MASGTQERIRSSRLVRRRTLSLVGSSVSIALVVALAWFVWLPRYRPGLGIGERYGIDVSEHQGRINWKSVRRDGIRFAYIKATEGGDFVDNNFATNWAAAGLAGIDRGAYHFFTLCAAGSRQAENWLRVLRSESGILPPAVDLELAGNCSERPALATMDRELGTFLSIVAARTHVQPILYVGHDFAARYAASPLLRRLQWRPRLLRRPSRTWVVWQVQPFAHINGINGRVDLDVMKAEVELSSLTGGYYRA